MQYNSDKVRVQRIKYHQACLHLQPQSLSLRSSSLGCVCLRELLKQANTLASPLCHLTEQTTH